MAISHWKNRSEQDKFTTIKKGFYSAGLHYDNVSLAKIHVNCYLVEMQFQSTPSQKGYIQKINFFHLV